MKTVLLIDEDEESRRIVQRTLSSETWRIINVQDVKSGLVAALKNRPDVIFYDLRSGGKDCTNLCRSIRAAAELAHTKIIATSIRDFPTDRREAQEAGAQYYLPKPINAGVLKQMLEHLFGDDTVASPSQRETQVLAPNAPGRLKFWGVRGSIPSPGPSTVKTGGNTSCVEVRANGELVILDAGSGIRPLGLDLAREFKGQPLEVTLLITHTHWDHIQGFPFFVPAYNPKNTIRLLGYEGARRSLQETMLGQMESPYFPISLQDMPSNLVITELRNLEFEVGSIRIKAIYVNHPGVCVGYRLFTQDGSVAYIPDNEPYLRLRSQPSNGDKSSHSATVEYARQQDQKLVDFIANADVLIMDSQYDEAEYASHAGWGHSCVDDTVTLAAQAGVKRLFLFHHDPTHDDRKLNSMLQHARQVAKNLKSRLKVDLAREGAEVALVKNATPGKKVRAV